MAIENTNDNLGEEVDVDDSVNETDSVDEDAGAEGKNQEGGNNNNTVKNNAQNKTFTQEQVNKMMTREKRQGRNAVYRELGIDPKDTKTIELLQSILKNSNNQNTTEEDNRVAEAEHRAIVAETKAQALQMGAQPNFVDDIVTLAMNKIKDDEDADAATVIGEIKTKYPAMFEKVQEEDKKKSGKAGTGSAIDSKTKPSSNKGSFGQRLAQQRKSNNARKNSFWS